MKNKAILFIIIGGFIGFSSCKKGQLKNIGSDVPDLPVDVNYENVIGNSWVKIQESYFFDKQIKGIGTVGDNMILTFLDYINQGTYFLSGHLSGDTNIVKHGLHYWPSGVGFEDVKVIDDKIYTLGYWDGIGVWKFDMEVFDDPAYNSWESVPVSYQVQPTAFTIYASEKIMGVASSPHVRSNSGNINFPDFVHSGNVRINALIEYKGDLICAGQFTSSNGTVLNNIAKWNGSEWVALGNGVNEEVRDLAVLDGKLVVGGMFTQVDGNSNCSRIAIWNGSGWEAMQSGLVGGSSGVHRLFVYGDQLFVGGDFTGAPSVNSKNIIKWKNGNWIGLPNTISEKIGEIGVYNGKLHVANLFHSMNGNFLMRLE
ncbi:hypothetical protein [Brumimicrobium mesophilum]|uniref:hypothetical protein n=1 Tax=Brumimicrobium mesophilum TaxID=392717 RepID=UPI000D13FADC|nr:hypothetical protein [Brumimicrobium mesophilum]